MWLLVFVLHVTGYSTVGNSYYQQAAPTVTSNSTVANSYYQQTAPTVTSNSTVASESSGANSQYVYQQTSYNPYQGNTLFVLCCMEMSFCVYCWRCVCFLGYSTPTNSSATPQTTPNSQYYSSQGKNPGVGLNSYWVLLTNCTGACIKCMFICTWNLGILELLVQVTFNVKIRAPSTSTFCFFKKFFSDVENWSCFSIYTETSTLNRSWFCTYL